MAFIMKTIEEEFAKIHVSILFECFVFWMGITVVKHRCLFFLLFFLHILSKIQR